MTFFYQGKEILFSVISEKIFSDEYLEPVPTEEPESDSGKFVLKHDKTISASKSKYDKPSKQFISESNFNFVVNDNSYEY